MKALHRVSINFNVLTRSLYTGALKLQTLAVVETQKDQNPKLDLVNRYPAVLYPYRTV